MKTFKLHWKDGKVETVKGETISEAFSRHGYGAGAIHALDHYEEVRDSTGVLAADLKLRDVVRLSENPFMDAVVKRIDDEKVFLFRPYATTADFEASGAVIPYIGIEEVVIFKYDSRPLQVIERPEPPK